MHIVYNFHFLKDKYGNSQHPSKILLVFNWVNQPCELKVDMRLSTRQWNLFLFKFPLITLQKDPLSFWNKTSNFTNKCIYFGLSWLLEFISCRAPIIGIKGSPANSNDNTNTFLNEMSNIAKSFLVSKGGIFVCNL